MVERRPAFGRLNGGDMSNGRGTGLTSAFDDLLARNRQQFDGLIGGTRSRPRRADSAAPPAGPAAAGGASIVLDASTSPTARILDARFGDGWRYEILERRDDGDVAVVSCRLVVAASGASVAGHGRAPHGSGNRVEGRIGEMPFSAGTAAADDNTLQSAWQAAAEQALAACLVQISA